MPPNDPPVAAPWNAAALESLNTLSDSIGYFKKARTGKAAASYEPEKDEDMTPTLAKEGFTFGCDPEVFIKNEKGIHVPPIGIIPGTKEQPEYMGDDVFLQIDGMAAEFNITPAANFEDFDARIGMALKKIKELLPKKWSVDVCSYVRFDPEVFDAAPPHAKELGCHPDCNAWTGEMNPPPNMEADPYLRTAAGHLHFGWTKDADLTDPQHILNCRDLVQQLDWYVGAWLLSKEPDNTRRQLYGRAGACRYKPYGVEYRVPSNVWITTKQNRMIVWNRMQAAVNSMSKMFLPERAGYYTQTLLNSINSGRLHPELARDGQYPIQTLDQRVCRF